MRSASFKKTGFYQKHKYRLRRANGILSIVSAALLMLFVTADQSDIAHKYQGMAAEIKIMALISGLHTGIYQVEPEVIKAMAHVPRHHFVSPKLQQYAYQNVALPLTDQNYILPEPYLTAMMIDLLDLNRGDTVLDIGYGAGYDAAIMSRMARKIYVLNQRGEVLDNTSFTPLESRGYKNIATRTGSDLRLWQDKGPFDAILVRGALPYPPSALLDQLNPGGRLVMPAGNAGELQTLDVYTKDRHGNISRNSTLSLLMAPLFAGHEI